MKMNSLPAEILLEIGKTNISTYRGMLAIPKFALAVTVGYRLDMMVGKYDYKKILLMIYKILPRCNVRIILRESKDDIFVRGICNNMGHITIRDCNLIGYCNIKCQFHSTDHNNGCHGSRMYVDNIGRALVDIFGTFYPRNVHF